MGLSNEVLIIFVVLVVFAQYQSELNKLKIFDQNFGKILHENDADEVLTSPCNMSIAGVKSSNVHSLAKLEIP